MIGSKWYISDSFSKYSNEYDTYAFIQKRAAVKFAEFIKNECYRFDDPISILEIGCGTGLLTQELVELLPNTSFHITDISDEMVSKAFLKLNSNYPGQFQFEVLDAESLPDDFDSDADFIASAFTFQWFENPALTIKHLFDSVPSCKKMCISYLAQGSFPEWKHYAQLAGVPFTANPLPDESDIRSFLRTYGFECNSKTIWMNQVYPNTLSFLNSIKHIGAGHSIQDHLLSPAQLRRLMKVWDTDCEYGIEVRHKVEFLEIKKGT